MSRGARPWLAGLLLVGALAACGSGGSGGTERTTLTVYAASSLTSTFQQLGKDFEADHPGVSVTFNFAGSSDLVAQLQEGAPADVFAAADLASMDKLVAAGLAGSDPVLFASNTLEVVVPPDNPAGIGSFADLDQPDPDKPGVDVVVCAPEVPCGAAAQRLAQAAGVTLRPVSEEQKVTDVLAKVAAGEADAGLVYVTDVLSAGDAVLGIPVPQASASVTVYPIATVQGSDHPDLAGEFIDLVVSDRGQQRLRVAGFAPATR
jgi:molybdate transport system substrate-binding protein